MPAHARAAAVCWAGLADLGCPDPSLAWARCCAGCFGASSAQWQPAQHSTSGAPDAGGARYSRSRPATACYDTPIAHIRRPGKRHPCRPMAPHVTKVHVQSVALLSLRLPVIRGYLLLSSLLPTSRLQLSVPVSLASARPAALYLASLPALAILCPGHLRLRLRLRHWGGKTTRLSLRRRACGIVYVCAPPFLSLLTPPRPLLCARSSRFPIANHPPFEGTVFTGH